MPIKIITRNDSAARWQFINPVLKKGEQGIEFLVDGTTKRKIGDGTTAWNDLDYESTGGSAEDIDGGDASSSGTGDIDGGTA